MAQPPAPGSPDHPLVHLPRCDNCSFYLSAPVLCKGIVTPEYEGLWFRKCFHNFPPVDTSCDKFLFTDLPRGHDAHPQLQIKCPGLACKSARSPNAVNINCLMGLCKQCCMRAQATVPGLRSCSVSSHNQGRRRGQVAPPPGLAAPPPPPPPAIAIPAPLVIPGWVPPPPPPPGCGAAPAADVAPVPAAASAAPAARVATAVVVNPAVSVAPAPPAPTTIDPALLAAPHLPGADSAQITVAQEASDEARFTQQLGRTKMLEFWDVDGSISQGHTVRVPHWPGFHPKDSPELVQAYGVDTKTCQYWDEERCRWWNCSPLTPARNVKGLDVLYYRAMGVTTGVGMPGLAMYDVADASASLGKRRAEDDAGDVFGRSGSPSFATPRKRIAAMPLTPASGRSLRQWPMTPSSLGSRAGSIPPTPSTCNSRFSATPSSSHGWSTPRSQRDGSHSPLGSSPGFARDDDVFDDFAFADSTGPSLRSRLEEAREDRSDSSDRDRSRPPSPSTPTLRLGVTPRSAAPSITLDPATIDLSKAPRGPRGWPLRYVQDMAAGFSRMRYLEDTAQMKRTPAFEAAFGVKWHKSTFHQNFNAWNDAGRRQGEQERWINFGHDRRGEWALFYQAWRRR